MIEVVTKEEGKKNEFPKLMIIEEYELIVLMLKNECGVVIEKGTSSYRIGQYLTSWNMNCFTNYNKEITIKNK